jgi:hypothetical protein
MSYGLQSFNTWGYTQIDSVTENFEVIQTGTSVTGQAYVTLPNTLPSDIMVFARPALAGRTAGAKAMSGYIYDQVIGGSRVLRAYMGSAVYDPNQYDPNDIYNACDYAVVRRAGLFTPPTATYGLNIFTPTNVLAYSTDLAQFRGVVARQVNITDTGSSFEGGQFNAAWYNGNITEAYALLGPYDTYYYEIQSIYIGDGGFGTYYFELYNIRKALFDYPNSNFGTIPVNFMGPIEGGTAASQTSTGIKTEIMGFII